jgi:hypothetical protein
MRDAFDSALSKLEALEAQIAELRKKRVDSPGNS